MLSNQQRIHMIQERLTNTLRPTHLEVIDESAQHVGHAGSSAGAGHFSVTIASPEFKGKTLVEKQRLVYKILEDMMPSEIHALRLKTE